MKGNNKLYSVPLGRFSELAWRSRSFHPYLAGVVFEIGVLGTYAAGIIAPSRDSRVPEWSLWVGRNAYFLRSNLSSVVRCIIPGHNRDRDSDLTWRRNSNKSGPRRPVMHDVDLEEQVLLYGPSLEAQTPFPVTQTDLINTGLAFGRGYGTAHVMYTDIPEEVARLMPDEFRGRASRHAVVGTPTRGYQMPRIVTPRVSTTFR